jgi:hypothetical protein
MIESVMYFGIGFLVATLLGLLFIPLLHNRAVRLTMRRLEASTPMSSLKYAPIRITFAPNSPSRPDVLR